jgi:murein DD-endopeptidase MepM/ murein hydrolase activator NlpD
VIRAANRYQNLLLREVWTMKINIMILCAVSLLLGLPAQSVELESGGKLSEQCTSDPNGPAVLKSVFPDSKKSHYILPYEANTSHLVWRTTSHHNAGNGGVGLYAIDIEMPIGTPLVASRAGKVIAVRDHFPDGNDKDLEENYVMVQHDDKTVARYIHLTQGGALVKLGDAVRQGQRIALSGNSGQTGGPHLHFDVQTCGPNLPPAYNALPCGKTIPVNFRNAEKNPCGLISNRKYFALPDRGAAGSKRNGD